MAKIEIVIIGVGKFGTEIINKIYQHPKYRIIAIDPDTKKINALSDKIETGYIGDATEDGYLESLGIESTDIFILGIGDNIQSSLLVTSIIKSKFPETRIIAKSVSHNHEDILKQLGVTDIISPDKTAAAKAVLKIISPFLGYKGSGGSIEEIGEDVSLFKMPCPPQWIDSLVKDINIDKDITIPLIKRKELSIIVRGDTILKENDFVFLIGKNNSLFKMLENSEKADQKRK